MNAEIGRDTLLALVAIAWADGVMDPKEATGIRSAASQINLPAEDLERVERAISGGITMADVETLLMGRETRLFTYAVAVWISEVDGHLAPEEEKALRLLGDRLGLSRAARERATEVARAISHDSTDVAAAYDLRRLEQQLATGLQRIGNA